MNKTKKLNNQSKNNNSNKTKSSAKKIIKLRPFTGIKLNNYKYPSNFSKRIMDDHNIEVLKYIEGILEPSIPVETGAIIKQPSLLPIPSTTVAFRNNINISTDASGDFFLSWNPNMLINTDVFSLYHMKSVPPESYEVNPDVLCHIMTKNDKYVRFYPTYVPKVAMAKYRLVSAKIKITYIGSNLNKSGMLYACATYDPTPIVMGKKTADREYLVYKDKLGNEIDLSIANQSMRNDQSWPIVSTYLSLNEQSISNGIWNKSCNVVQTNQGISCLHVPCDPTSQIFYPMGTYFGNPLKDYICEFNQIDSAIGSIMREPYSSYSGSQLSYLICGHGLPANNECINIQVYYNYEVIPTSSSAPFMRTADNTLKAKDIPKINNIISQNAPRLSIRSGVSTPTSKTSSWLSKIGKGISFAKGVFDLVSALGKAI